MVVQISIFYSQPALYLALAFHFGDWCSPEGTAKDWIAKGKWIGTAYFANSCGIAAKIARILGFDQDAEYYSSLREKIIKAYRRCLQTGQAS